MKVIRYINLTQGLEQYIRSPDNDYRFCYLKSSHIESRSFNKFIMSVPADILLNLALGNKVIIFDVTSNGKSKITDIGVRLINVMLDYFWFNVPFPRDKWFDTYLNCYKKLDKQSKKHIRYYRKFILTNTVNLFGHKIRLQKEQGEIVINKFLKLYQEIQDVQKNKSQTR